MKPSPTKTPDYPQLGNVINPLEHTGNFVTAGNTLPDQVMPPTTVVGSYDDTVVESGQQATKLIHTALTRSLAARGQQATTTPALDQLIRSQQATLINANSCTTDTLGMPPGEHHDLDQLQLGTPTHQLPPFLQRIGYPEPPDAPTNKDGIYSSVDDFDCVIADDIAPEKTPPGDGNCNRASWPFPSQCMPSHLADMYERAREADRQKDPSLRPIIPTSLNLSEWEARATGHDHDAWIIDALKHGFPM